MLTNKAIEQKKMITAFLVPVIFLLLMWGVFLIEQSNGLRLSKFGLRPRDAQGFLGIFTMPFLHGSWEHIINNSVPMLVLGSALFYFYRELAYRVLFIVWFAGGLWVWLSARDSFHIGASGLVYGLAAFLFLSGALRKDSKLIAISLLVAFLYGSMVWGLLPIREEISYEGHIWGSVAGVVLAIYYRKRGPKPPKYQWQVDEEREQEQLKRAQEQMVFNYIVVSAEDADFGSAQSAGDSAESDFGSAQSSGDSAGDSAAENNTRKGTFESPEHPNTPS